MDSVNIKDLDAGKSPHCEEDLELCKQTDQPKTWAKTPFPIDDDINRRVVLYNGDIKLLSADAIVNPTNENLTQTGFIGRLAGPELESHLKKKVKLCSTGDVRLTPGFQSNFNYIIHAVPPKYQAKYKTAAETALFHTYFRILETVIEKQIRTLVMPTLATQKCNLPIDENFQMQLRIVRRFLEKKRHHIDRIIVHVQSDGSNDRSCNSFFYYFPQTSLDEEIACYRLGASIGGLNGEPVIPEREIRIKSKPVTGLGSNTDSSIDLTSGLDLSTVVGKTAFSKMQDDPSGRPTDKKVLKASNGASSKIAIRKPTVFRGCTLL